MHSLDGRDKRASISFAALGRLTTLQSNLLRKIVCPAAANTADFIEGDVGYIPKTLGHYVENTGDTDLVFLEMFRAPRFQDISLNNWLTHIPPELVLAHLGITPETLAAIPRANNAIVPVT